MLLFLAMSKHMIVICYRFVLVAHMHHSWHISIKQSVCLKQIVLDPLSRNTCRDIFTGLQPKWSISTPYGSNYVSPLTTLAVAARRTAAVAVASSEVIDNPDAGPTLEDTAEVVSQVDISDRLSNDHGPNGRTQEVDRDPVWVDPSFSSGLMLEPQQIMQIDVVHEVLMNQDQSSERAMVLSVVLANTVTQVQQLQTLSLLTEVCKIMSLMII